MRKYSTFFIAIILIVSANSQSVKTNYQIKNFDSKNDLRTISFDAEWLFRKDSSAQLFNQSTDDSKWRKLDLPHDWSIEDLPNQIVDSIVGPFSKAAISQHAGGFLVGGTAWYRKHFITPKTSAGKETLIQFDGVYMNAEVWINGYYLGLHPHGYTSFYYNLTQYLKPAGQSNLIAVKVRNEGQNSRWYSGSGIYRHVWLSIVHPTHIKTWGTYITTHNISAKSAAIQIETNIQKSKIKSNLTVQVEILNATGKLMASSQKNIAANTEVDLLIKQTVNLVDPKLWSLEDPYLYQTKTKILLNGKIIDEVKNEFGIRSIHFDTLNGFTLNGKTLKLKGGCIHHDNGPLGSAAIDRAEERKIELLKKQGYNAIRLSHNPPSPQLLNACDRLGMMVIDEAFDMWEKSKTPDDYHLYFKEWWQKDLSSMVLRDRNHPSIIMWSIGNEIPEVLNETGYQIGKNLSVTVRSLDTTRPLTIAIPLFAPLLDKGKKWDNSAASFANVDVSGYNYALREYENDHKKYPNRIMYASEYFPPKGMENWKKVEALNYVIGTFSWSAMDYIGEAGLGVGRIVNANTKNGGLGSEGFLTPSWPIYISGTGELDLIGNKKVNSYYLDVVWKRSPIEMLVHQPIPTGKKEMNFYYNFPDQIKSWTWPGMETKNMEVYVYTRSQNVVLELNGNKVGEQKLLPDNNIAKFDILYTPGILIAKSYTNKQLTGADTLKTVGKPAAIRLFADRKTLKADRNDLSYISVEIVDEKGNLVPYVDDLEINYSITGGAEIAGIANGNPKDISSFQQKHKKVFQGRGLVIIRPTIGQNKIIVKANAKSLKEGLVEILTTK
jgi:beta-galactosidase